MLLLELCRDVFAIYHFVRHGYVASQYDVSPQALRLLLSVSTKRKLPITQVEQICVLMWSTPQD